MKDTVKKTTMFIFNRVILLQINKQSLKKCVNLEKKNNIGQTLAKVLTEKFITNIFSCFFLNRSGGNTI